MCIKRKLVFLLDTCSGSWGHPWFQFRRQALANHKKKKKKKKTLDSELIKNDKNIYMITTTKKKKKRLISK